MCNSREQIKNEIIRAVNSSCPNDFSSRYQYDKSNDINSSEFYFKQRIQRFDLDTTNAYLDGVNDAEKEINDTARKGGVDDPIFCSYSGSVGRLSIIKTALKVHQGKLLRDQAQFTLFAAQTQEMFKVIEKMIADDPQYRR